MKCVFFFCILGGIRPSYSWVLAYVVSLDRHSTTVTKVVEGCVYIRRRFLCNFSHERRAERATVTKVVEGCVYIRRRFNAISLMRGERREPLSALALSALLS